MFDSKFIATLFAVAISVFAICNINTNRVTSNEGFGWGGCPSTETTRHYIGAKSMKEYNEGKTYSLSESDIKKIYQGHGGGSQKNRKDSKENFDLSDYMDGSDMNFRNNGDFFSTANWQPVLSPRVDPGVMGTYIRYDPPRSEYMAVPSNPMDYVGMVVNGPSGYKGGCTKENFVEAYGAENSLMNPNYSEGNYNSLAGGNMLVTSDLLPVQNMSSLNVDDNGQPTQCVIFERIIHSNRNNRRRSQGDPIRGDLPIAPINNGWFNTSANPVEDLQQGAMNVMNGLGSDSSIAMADFINKQSGGTKTAIAGVDLNELPPSKYTSINQKFRTVQVS